MNKRFHLVITETIANENYAAEVEQFEKASRGNYYPGGQVLDSSPGYPSRNTVIKILDVTVTETEFAAIKKAALETMA